MRFTKTTTKDDGQEIVMTIDTSDAGEANTLRATGWEQIPGGDADDDADDGGGEDGGAGAGSPGGDAPSKPRAKESRTEPDRVGFDAPKVTRTGKTD